MKNIIKSTLIFFAASVLLASCSLSLNKKPKTVRVSFTTVADLVKNAVTAADRSISPSNTDQNFFDSSNTIYRLSGKSDDNTYEGDGYNLSEFENLSVDLAVGKWDFTLSVYLYNDENKTVYYEANTTVDLESDGTTVAFKLQACTVEDATGDITYYFNVPLDYDGTPVVNLVNGEGETYSKDGTPVAGDLMWENDEENNIRAYRAEFNDVPVNTYKILIGLPSSITTETYTYTDSDEERAFETSESVLNYQNVRLEFGILVMPELLTSNEDAPRDYTKINSYVPIKYRARLISDTSDSGGVTTNMTVYDLPLYCNAGIGGYEKLKAPVYDAKYPGYLTSWNYAFKEWIGIEYEIDDEGNTVSKDVPLSTKTVGIKYEDPENACVYTFTAAGKGDKDITVWLLPRNNDFNRVEAIYEKSNCEVTFDSGDATWNIDESDRTITGALNETVIVPGSSENVPKMPGWSFVGFTETETELDKTITASNYEEKFSDYYSIGAEYEITGSVTLYSLWYYNGSCDFSAAYTVPASEDNTNPEAVSIGFEDNVYTMSDIEYGTTIAFTTTTSDAEIMYLESDTEIASPDKTDFVKYSAAIVPENDCFIYAYTTDTTEKYEDSDIYTIEVAINKNDVPFTVSGFQFTLTDLNDVEISEDNTFTIELLDPCGNALDETIYKNLLEDGSMKIKWYLNGNLEATENTLSITIHCDTDMYVKSSLNEVFAEVTYGNLFTRTVITNFIYEIE